MLGARGGGKDKPAPTQGAQRGEMRPHTNVCGSGRCLLSVIKRQRENWENSTADADFQLGLSHRQDLGSRWWEWGAEVGGPGGWMEEPRTRWRAGHIWKRVSHPASLQPRKWHQTPVQSPLPGGRCWPPSCTPSLGSGGRRAH